MGSPSAGALKRASLVLLAAALIWGSMIPVLAALAEHYDKWLLSWLRYILGLPVLWVAVLMSMRQAHGARPAPRPLNAGRLFQLGVAMTAFSVLYTFGVAHAHPATSAIVLMCGPIWATLLSRVMLGTGTPPGFTFTLLLVVGGGVVVVLGSPGKSGGIALEGGEPLLVIAQLCWTWYSIRAQQWLADRGQIALSALTSSVASVQLGIVCMVVWATVGIDWPTRLPTATEGAMLVWIGVLGVAIAVLLWNTGVSLVGVPVASLFSNTAPIFAIGLAALMGREPSWLQIVGGAVVMGGIALHQLRQIQRAGR